MISCKFSISSTDDGINPKNFCWVFFKHLVFDFPSKWLFHRKMNFNPDYILVDDYFRKKFHHRFFTVSKTCIFDPSKQVKVVFFSWKRNSYPHTSLCFSTSKYVTRHIRNISLFISPKAWHMRNTRKKLSNQISQPLNV